MHAILPPMKPASRLTIRASLNLLGTIIGAGVFAVPAVMKEFGIPWGTVAFWGIALVILVTHLLYAEAVLARKGMGKKRLPGHVTAVLGKTAGFIAFASHPLHIIGVGLAYLILGGEFLAVLARMIGLPGSVICWQVFFWAGGAVTTLFGLKFVSKIESALTWVLIGLLMLSVGLLYPSANPDLFFAAGTAPQLASLGIFVFSMFGLTIVPEVVELVDNNLSRARIAITIGTLGAAILIWLFGIFMFAAAPALVGHPAGMSAAYPLGFVWLIPAVGFFAVATSFITSMQDLRSMFMLDLKFSSTVAWAMAIIGPLVMLFIASGSFLTTVSWVGSMFSATNGFLACLVAFAVLRKTTPLWKGTILPLVCAGVFLSVFISRILSTS